MAGVPLLSIRLDEHNIPLVSLGHRDHFAAILSEGADGRRWVSHSFLLVYPEFRVYCFLPGVTEAQKKSCLGGAAETEFTP